jgi:hypothetical protein
MYQTTCVYVVQPVGSISKLEDRVGVSGEGAHALYENRTHQLERINVWVVADVLHDGPVFHPW